MNKSYKNVKEENLNKIAEEINNFIKIFFDKNDRSCILFLKGDLGAGKTTFTKFLAKSFGIKDDIVSPTFALRRDYKNLIHVDGYRLEKEEDGKSLELEKELNQKGKLIIIEWPERFTEGINLKPDFTMFFKHKSEKEREISVSIN